jgi:predicted DCC family thiol-disulfide oxidoreductase YuxK
VVEAPFANYGDSVSPPSAVIVPRFVVVVVVVGSVAVVVVGSVAVVVVGAEVVVVGLVVVGVVVGLVVGSVVALAVVVVWSSPSSAATTASATPSPITAATRTAISAFIAPLMPLFGGSPYGGWPPRSGGGTSIRRVGSSCTGGESRRGGGLRSGAMTRPALLYDADCGVCTWLVAGILAWDRRRRLRPVALQAPEADSLLGGMDEEAKMASWHLVGRDGSITSAGAALAPLMRELPGGVPLAAMAERAPGLVDRGYRWTAAHRGLLGRPLPERWVEAARDRVAARSRT